MRWTQTLIPTLKEIPSEAEVASHILMIRAGLIRKLASGTYSYLPLGFRVLKKVEEIVRQEMDAAGAVRVLLPAIHPVELWQKTKRYELLGEDMISFKDRHNKINVLGPTHEEVITGLVADEVRSYKELPLILYQIQTKFRDETRPRFGVIRSREFIMKDAYSFNKTAEDLNESYKKMYDAYSRIFDRCGLNYIIVEADPGFMGGDVSHEFMVPCDTGEDVIVVCKSCKYAASLEKGECTKSTEDRVQRTEKNKKPLKEVTTPGVMTVEKVSAFLKTTPDNLVKTLIYIADEKPVAVLVRGDHEVNPTKLKRVLGCENLQMADEATIEKTTGGPLGFSGPVGLKDIKMLADYGIAAMSNFVTGANKKDAHLVNVNLNRDFNVEEWLDLRYITKEDKCPKCKKDIEIKHAIEVGHTFKLGTKYSKALGAKYIDEEGKGHTIIMGCYGIGVNRIVASAIEQSNDKDGIIWPLSIAPYEVLVLPTNMSDERIAAAACEIYEELKKNGVDVLLDDRNLRAGIKFKDADLIGIPLQVVIGNKFLEEAKVEIKFRKTKKAKPFPKSHVTKEVLSHLSCLTP